MTITNKNDLVSDAAPGYKEVGTSSEQRLYTADGEIALAPAAIATLVHDETSPFKESATAATNRVSAYQTQQDGKHLVDGDGELILFHVMRVY